MARPRSTQVCLSETPYYHCVSRCVRHAFLFGDDPISGKNLDHRKVWIETALRELPATFAVQVCAYAVMCNHFHGVLRVDEALAQSWSKTEVVSRYGGMFPMAKAKFDASPTSEKAVLIEVWRTRLYDISWMMRSINEGVARKANKEDNVTGRFWEGRFKSRPLLDEGALLSCMAYVDLNPVRAGLSDTLEFSDFTSICARLRSASERMKEAESAPDVGAVNLAASPPLVPQGLMPFADQLLKKEENMTAPEDATTHITACVPMDFLAYVELLQWTGEALRQDKPSGRLQKPPELLTQVGLDPDVWLQTMKNSGMKRVSTVGHINRLQALATLRGKRWLRGQGWAKRAYAA